MDISIILIIVGVLGFFYARGCRQEKEREEKKHSRIRTHEEWQKYLEEEQRELDKLSRNWRTLRKAILPVLVPPAIGWDFLFLQR